MSNGFTKDPLHYRSWECRGVHTHTSMVDSYRYSQFQSGWPKINGKWKSGQLA